MSDKEKKVGNNKDLLKNDLQLKFCLDHPLKDLRSLSIEYFNLCTTEIINPKEELTFKYCDLLDSIFYLFAVDSKIVNKQIVNNLKLLANAIHIDNQAKVYLDNELINYCKTYISLILKRLPLT